jgi:hypothetical protein
MVTARPHIRLASREEASDTAGVAAAAAVDSNRPTSLGVDAAARSLRFDTRSRQERSTHPGAIHAIVGSLTARRISRPGTPPIRTVSRPAEKEDRREHINDNFNEKFSHCNPRVSFGRSARKGCGPQAV